MFEPVIHTPVENPVENVIHNSLWKTARSPAERSEAAGLSICSPVDISKQTSQPRTDKTPTGLPNRSRNRHRKVHSDPPILLVRDCRARAPTLRGGSKGEGRGDLWWGGFCCHGPSAADAQSVPGGETISSRRPTARPRSRDRTPQAACHRRGCTRTKRRDSPNSDLRSTPNPRSDSRSPGR